MGSSTADPGETHGRGPLNADDHYVVISADCHGGGEIHEYRDFLASQYHDEFDAWVDGYDDPLPRPARRPREAQLGLRPARARPRGRRHRRRGDLPQHDPAVLPRWRAGHADPARRRARPRAAVGRAAGAQPLAGRLLRAHARAGAPASRRSCCTTSTHRSRRSAGRTPTGSPAGSSCPARRPASGCCRCTASTTTRSGRCAKSSACRSTTTAAARVRRAAWSRKTS